MTFDLFSITERIQNHLNEQSLGDAITTHTAYSRHNSFSNQYNPSLPSPYFPPTRHAKYVRNASIAVPTVPIPSTYSSETSSALASNIAQVANAVPSNVHLDGSQQEVLPTTVSTQSTLAGNPNPTHGTIHKPSRNRKWMVQSQDPPLTISTNFKSLNKSNIASQQDVASTLKTSVNSDALNPPEQPSLQASTALPSDIATAAPKSAFVKKYNTLIRVDEEGITTFKLILVFT